MRKIDSTQEHINERNGADPNCPFCRGDTWCTFSGLDYNKLAGVEDAERYLRSGTVAYAPPMGVVCPKCHPDGIKIGRKRWLTLRQHADKIRETMPYEYFILLCTLVYFRMHADWGDETLPLLQGPYGIEGIGERHIMENFEKNLQIRPKSMVAMIAKAKKVMLSPEQKEEKRERARRELARMMGENYDEEI